MDHSAWDEHLAALVTDAGAIGEFDGRKRVLRFGEIEDEYRAICRGGAMVDRGDRALIEVTGDDRADWLHNLTTNQVRTLSPGEGVYAFVLNVQGRILFDVNVFVLEKALWVDLDREHLAPALAHFDKYLITEDAALADRTDEFRRLGVVFGDSAAFADRAGASNLRTMAAGAIAGGAIGGVAVRVARNDFCGTPAAELFVPKSSGEAVWAALIGGDNALTPAGDEALDIRRIERGIPRFHRECAGEHLPAETRQFARAVSFQKGCYLGQEVVERMRSRGVVARLLSGLVIEGESVPCVGAAVCGADGAAVGTVTSACRSIELGKSLCLAYLKKGAAAAGAPLRVGDGDAAVDAQVTNWPPVGEPLD